MTTSNSASQRHAWSVAALDIQPDDHVLEIGCGHGVAISLICAQLDTGRVVGLDRSAKTREQAEARNAAWLAAGKVTFVTGSLFDVQLGDHSFDKVFASHINVFLRNPAAELAIIARLLKPEGAFSLLFQPLSPEKIPLETAAAKQNLAASGYTIVSERSEMIVGGPAFCFTALPHR